MDTVFLKSSTAYKKKKKKKLLTYIHHFNNKSHMLSEAGLLSFMQRLLNVETDKEWKSRMAVSVGSVDC